MKALQLQDWGLSQPAAKQAARKTQKLGMSAAAVVLSGGGAAKAAKKLALSYSEHGSNGGACLLDLSPSSSGGVPDSSIALGYGAAVISKREECASHGGKLAVLLTGVAQPDEKAHELEPFMDADVQRHKCTLFVFQTTGKDVEINLRPGFQGRLGTIGGETIVL